MGSIALYPVLFFFSIFLGVRSRFSARWPYARARVYFFPLRDKWSLIWFAHTATRKVNYIIRTSFRAIAIVSNVSRRGILNIFMVRSAIFRSWTASEASPDIAGSRLVHELLRLQFTVACRAILFFSVLFFFPWLVPTRSSFAALYRRSFFPANENIFEDRHLRPRRITRRLRYASRCVVCVMLLPTSKNVT